MKIDSIAIVGSGAVGCYYGAQIARLPDGPRVSFLMRSDLSQVQSAGLVVESNEHENFIVSPVHCYATTEEIGAVDLVIIALKATDNAALDGLIPPLLHDDTRLLTLQNGMGNEDYLAERFGAERVLGGLCFVCLNRTSPGVIRHIGHGLIEMGEFSSGPQDRTRQIADLINRSGVPCEVLESLELSRWRKLVWNIPFNGLAIAGGGIDVGKILNNVQLHKRVRNLMEEVIQTAGKLGHEIPRDFIEVNIERTYPMGDYKPSSLIDHLAGKPVEVEAIWGEPLRRGKAAGVEMPELESLYSEIKEIVVAN